MRLIFVVVLLSGVGRVLTGQTPAYLIDTVAGSGWIGDGGPAVQAILRQPGGMAADASGNVYIAETGGHRVRKLARSGVITTVAGTGTAGFSGDGTQAVSAQIASPYGLAADALGNLYIADLGNARVRRVSADGIITTVAGGGSLAPGPDNEGKLGTEIALVAPRNLALDDVGNLYISDFGGHRVFRLATDGTLTTVAGTGTQGYSGDGGLAAAAQLAYPAGLAMGFDGALYIADSLNHAVRKVSGGVITTFASAGTPVGLAFDPLGTLYVADVEAGALLRSPMSGSLPPVNIAAADVARALDFSMYAPDSAAGVVRRIALTGEVTAVAGGGDTARGDGDDARLALLNHPSGVAADASGNLYIADRDNNRIRRVSVDGIITTISTGADLRAPSAVSLDTAGNLYIADTGNDRVLRLAPSGDLQVLAPDAKLSSPGDVVADQAGNVYIADTGSGSIRKVSTAGALTTILDGLAGPRGLALDGAGHLFFTEQDARRVRRLNLATGEVTELGPGAWSVPRGIAVNDAGEVFVADTGLQQILRVDSAGNVTAIAGTGVAGLSGDYGPAAKAQLSFPWDVAPGPGGVLYIADLDNHRVRRLSSGTPPGPGSLSGAQVLNGVSLASGPIAPGMLLSIRGTGIPTADSADTLVLINSIPVSIVSMDDTQIQVQAPLAIVAPGDVDIVVVHQGSIAATLTATAAASAPALFGPVNTDANPLPRGAVVALLGTGLGLGDLPVSVAIGGVTAEIVSVDSSPGYPGLFQLGVRIPAAAPAGTSSVVVTVGDAASAPVAVTIH